MNQTRALAARKNWAGVVLYACLAILSAIAIAACSDAGGPPPSTSPVPTQLVRGQHIFATYCASCHVGGPGPYLGSKNLPESKIETTVRHGEGMMPGFGTNSISDDDLTQLVDYVQSLRQ